MHSAAYHLGIYLPTIESLNLTLDVNLFLGESVGQDSQIVLLDGVARPSPNPDSYENVNVRVLVYGAVGQNYFQVYSRAFAIYRAILDIPCPIIIDGVEYGNYSAVMMPSRLGVDEYGREVFSFNFNNTRGSI